MRVWKVTLLSISGSVQGHRLDQLRQRIEAATAPPDVDGLSLDLSGVARCDAALFHLLAQADTELADRGVQLFLIGLSGPVLDVLEDAELHDVLVVYRMSRSSLPGFASSRSRELLGQR